MRNKIIFISFVTIITLFLVLSCSTPNGGNSGGDGTPPATAPEINISGDGSGIVSCGNFDFGNVLTSGDQKEITFTIQNIGTASLNLMGTPVINKSGANETEFTIDTTGMLTSIPASSSTTFTITFDPASDGAKVASISISNDDADENPYTFTINGTGVAASAPEINLKQVSTNIASGGTYNFGSVNSGSSSAEIIFTIQNIGNADLNLTGTPIVSKSGTNQNEFTLTQPSSSIVSTGENTTFTIIFSPTSVGDDKTATITIANNDSDEGTYTFTVNGNGVANNTIFGAFTENFEMTDLDQVPDGWNVEDSDADTYAGVVNTISHGGTRCLNNYSNSAASRPLVRIFIGDRTYGQLKLYFRIPSSSNMNSYCAIMADAHTKIIDVCLNKNNQIQIRKADSTKTDLMSYNFDQWYKLELRWDKNTGYSKILIDDNDLGNYVMMTTDATDSIAFQADDTGSGQIYIDDIDFTIDEIVVPSWQYVGNRGFSSVTPDNFGNGGGFTLFVYDDLPYITYGKDNSGTMETTVMHYDGANWGNIGSSPITGSYAGWPSLFVYNDIPYVAFEDGTAVSVMKYASGSWGAVTGGTASDSEGMPKIFVYSNVIYLAAHSQGKVFKYESGSWAQLGSDIGPDADDFDIRVIGADVYIAYVKDTSSYKLNVKKYNTGHSSWDQVGDANFGTANAQKPLLHFYGGNYYIAYEDTDNSNKIKVYKLNSGTWELYASNSNNWGNADFYNGECYVVYPDSSNSNKVSVQKYNGTSWVNVGSTGFSPAITSSGAIIFASDGIPYVIFKDSDNSNKLSVMKYE